MHSLNHRHPDEDRDRVNEDDRWIVDRLVTIHRIAVNVADLLVYKKNLCPLIFCINLKKMDFSMVRQK